METAASIGPAPVERFPDQAAPLTHEDCAVIAYHLGFARHHHALELAGLEKLLSSYRDAGMRGGPVSRTRQAIAKARADIDRTAVLAAKLTALQALLAAHPEVAR
jgi:hypothetical protein